jgi:hypothetical protein
MPTDDELAALPHIIMTSDVDWDPSKFDNDITNFMILPMITVKSITLISMGEYCHCTVATHLTCVEKEFYDARVSSSILMIKLMTYWTPLIRKLLVNLWGTLI